MSTFIPSSHVTTTMSDNVVAVASSYYAQLAQTPAALLNIHTLNELQSFYTTSDPLVLGFAISLAISPIFLVVSEVKRNYSQVDRAWSILPSLFHGHYVLWAWLNGIWMGRIALASLCILVCKLISGNACAVIHDRRLETDPEGFLFVLIGSVRLTYNFWRKGGYHPNAEDYRWAFVKKKLPTNRVVFFVFNAVFISTWQTIVLFLVTAPSYVLLSSTDGTQPKYAVFRAADIVFAVSIIALVLAQGVADQQQWTYQQAKKEKRVVPNSSFTAADLQRGFATHGLWAYSRHPNVLAEQSIWVMLFVWSWCLAGFNWSVVGTITYLLPFLDSAKLTESISSAKYKQYKDYQAQVGMFLPLGGTWKGVQQQFNTKKRN